MYCHSQFQRMTINYLLKDTLYYEQIIPEIPCITIDVCIYYNEKISVRQMSNNRSLSECLTWEIVIGKKKGYVITLYQSPSKNQGEFEYFILSLENLPGNMRNQDPAYIILYGDFNARSKSWWVHDIIINEGTQIESISLL